MTSPTYEPADWCQPQYGSCALLSGHEGPHHGYPQNILTAAEQLLAQGSLSVDPATTVTLRPDNPDDVKRLADALDSLSTAGAWTASDAVAAMRSLLPPSAPPEPNGLGAVVEVRSDIRECRVKCVRTHATKQPWSGDGVAREWSQLPAVTVLTHGYLCSCSGPGCPGGEQDG